MHKPVYFYEEEKKTMKFSTTIKREYWEEKLESVKERCYFYEYKADTPFWHKRLSKLRDNLPAEGVFLVGSEVKRVVITEILRSLACYIPEKYENMFNTDYVWVLKCWLVGGDKDEKEP
ncbi:MAG: hypothetical protein DRI61_08295 [Chloroflexi bacterium]|nr:MAG: hypothetical protein DRI61_08295 [Chloroflexota bacterium]